MSRALWQAVTHRISCGVLAGVVTLGLCQAEGVGAPSAHTCLVLVCRAGAQRHCPGRPQSCESSTRDESGCCPAPRRRPARGTLLISVQVADRSVLPAGVVVSVDGVDVSVLNGEARENVSVGQHAIEARAPGFEPARASASVRANRVTASALQLVRTISCTGGQVVVRDEEQHCCWPGQLWVTTSSSCTGTPQCPTGQVAEGTACGIACGSNQRFEGGRCVYMCPPNMHEVGGACDCDVPLVYAGQSLGCISQSRMAMCNASYEACGQGVYDRQSDCEDRCSSSSCEASCGQRAVEAGSHCQTRLEFCYRGSSF